jgi:hypothetical protein
MSNNLDYILEKTKTKLGYDSFDSHNSIRIYNQLIYKIQDLTGEYIHTHFKDEEEARLFCWDVVNYIEENITMTISLLLPRTKIKYSLYCFINIMCQSHQIT